MWPAILSALECCHKGWDESVIIGVAGAGRETSAHTMPLERINDALGLMHTGNSIRSVIDYYNN